MLELVSTSLVLSLRMISQLCWMIRRSGYLQIFAFYQRAR